MKTVDPTAEEQQILEAAKQGKHEEVTRLLGGNSELIEAKDSENKTILDHAVENGHPQVVEAVSSFFGQQADQARQEKYTATVALQAEQKKLEELRKQVAELDIKGKKEKSQEDKESFEQKKRDEEAKKASFDEDKTNIEASQRRINSITEAGEKESAQRVLDGSIQVRKEYEDAKKATKEAKEKSDKTEEALSSAQKQFDDILTPKMQVANEAVVAASLNQEDVAKKQDPIIKTADERAEGAAGRIEEAKGKKAEIDKKQRTEEIFDAVKKGDTKAVTDLLKTDPTLAQAVDKDGKTPLHHAAENGHKDVVVELALGDDMKLRENILDAQDSKGRTPLHYAAENLDRETGKVLVELGAKKDITDNKGKTSEQLGNAALVMKYAKEGNLDKIKPFLDTDPTLAQAVDKDGKTPLHHAAENGHMNVAEELIKDKTTLNVRDNSGKMPIHYAAERGDQEMFSALGKAGAMTSVPVGEGGKTPQEILDEALRVKEMEKQKAEALEAERLAKAASKAAPVQSSQDKDASQHHTPADYFGGKLKDLKFTPSVGEERDFTNGQRAMSDPTKSHVAECVGPNGSFFYKIEVKQGDSPTKLHKVEGDFGHLVFNAEGKMIGAELSTDPKALATLHPEQLKDAQKLIAENISRSRASSIDINDPQHVAGQAPVAPAPRAPAPEPPSVASTDRSSSNTTRESSTSIDSSSSLRSSSEGSVSHDNSVIKSLTGHGSYLVQPSPSNRLSSKTSSMSIT